VTGVEVIGERGKEEGEGVRVAAREAGEEAERERVREHAEEVVGREGGGGIGAAEQGERVGGGDVVEWLRLREAGEGGEEVREEARGGEAEDGEAGVRLLDLAGGGRAARQERAE
jgi:hypothetical protein